MRIVAATFGLVALVVAGSVAAETRITDVDFLKASRCRGLAASPVGEGVDTTQLDALHKTQRGVRPEFILQKADEEMTRARRQARDADRQPRLKAELAGPCASFLGGGAVAAAGASRPAS